MTAPREQVYLKINVDAYSEVVLPTAQLTAIVKLIFKNQPLNEVRLDELLRLATDAGELRTRQNPWLIYNFYRQSLIIKGVLVEFDDPLYLLKERIDAEASIGGK